MLSLVRHGAEEGRRAATRQAAAHARDASTRSPKQRRRGWRRSFGQPIRLTALARALHTSPFHLARVFRSETGFTVEGYRQALRLRAALELLPSTPTG